MPVPKAGLSVTVRPNSNILVWPVVLARLEQETEESLSEHGAQRKTNLVQGRDPVLEDHSPVEEIQMLKGTGDGTGQLRYLGSTTWMPLCPCRHFELAGQLWSFLFLPRRVGVCWESASEVQPLKVVGLLEGQPLPPAAATPPPHSIHI